MQADNATTLPSDTTLGHAKTQGISIGDPVPVAPQPLANDPAPSSPSIGFGDRIDKAISQGMQPAKTIATIKVIQDAGAGSKKRYAYLNLQRLQLADPSYGRKLDTVTNDVARDAAGQSQIKIGRNTKP